MHIRGGQKLHNFAAPFALLLTIVFSALLLPNSHPFGVSASGESTGARTTGSIRHSRISGHTIQNSPPTEKMQAVARRAEEREAALELQAKKYKEVLKAGASSLGLNDRLPKSSDEIIKKAPLNRNEWLEKLEPRPRMHPMDNPSVGHLIMKNPLVKDALQMLDTLGLPKEPSQETLNQLRFLFTMLSDDLNLYNEKRGKCIYLPRDSQVLSRLKALAKYYALNVATAKAIITLPPFHELFCFSGFQPSLMMPLLDKYKSMKLEYAAIEKVYLDNMEKSDEFGPFAFNPIERFSFSLKREEVVKNGEKSIKKTIVNHPFFWVMRDPPVKSCPIPDHFVGLR